MENSRCAKLMCLVSMADFIAPTCILRQLQMGNVMGLFKIFSDVKLMGRYRERIDNRIKEIRGLDIWKLNWAVRDTTAFWARMLDDVDFAVEDYMATVTRFGYDVKQINNYYENYRLSITKETLNIFEKRIEEDAEDAKSFAKSMYKMMRIPEPNLMPILVSEDDYADEGEDISDKEEPAENEETGQQNDLKNQEDVVQNIFIEAKENEYIAPVHNCDEHDDPFKKAGIYVSFAEQDEDELDMTYTSGVSAGKIKFVEEFLKSALQQNYLVSVHNGEHFSIRYSENIDAIIGALDLRLANELILYSPDHKRAGWILLGGEKDEEILKDMSQTDVVMNIIESI